MFNLEEAIAQWRRQMVAAGFNSSEVLDELESHLRDQIDQMIGCGVDARSAYAAAVARVGETTSLRGEFAKIEPANQRPRAFLWFFYFGAVALLPLINSWTLLEYDLGTVERLVGFFILLLVTLYLVLLPHLVWSVVPRIGGRLLSMLKITSNVVCLWPILALFDALHLVNLRIGMVPAMALWCACAAAGLSAVACVLSRRADPNSGSGGAPPSFRPQSNPTPPARPFTPHIPIRSPRGQASSPLVQEVLEAAAQEASRLGHHFIGTEHVLLGLLMLAKGTFADALARLHLDHEHARLEIERLVAPVPSRGARAAIPLTPRTLKAFHLASREAKALKHPLITAEHIFLGLLLESGGFAGQALRNLGFHPDQTRKELLRASFPRQDAP